MLSYLDHQLNASALTAGRIHPWSVQTSNPENRYIDFKKNPELIETSLEDLQPIAGSMAAQAVIEFLRWANSPECIFETNDFGMRPLKPNESGVSPSALELHARVTILFRDLRRNIGQGQALAFGHRLELELQATDEAFRQACWGWYLWPHKFQSLVDAGKPSEGNCLALAGWAWGDDKTEVHSNFARALTNLQTSLKNCDVDFKP
jgi:hypothetical protein